MYAGTVEPDPALRSEAQFLTAVGYVLLYTAAWAVGYWAGRSRRRVQLLERQHLIDEQAVVEERLRIARELHDIVSHAVSIIVLHADAAEHYVEKDADAAKRGLRVIKESGQQAADDLRCLLGVLYTGAPDGDGLDEGQVGQRAHDARHVPGVAEIARVVATLRGAGVEVELKERGVRRPLDPMVDLAAYRVVQEGLTNVTKHAGAGAVAEVSLIWADEGLLVRVHDDGKGAPARGHRRLTTGHGLVGLRERVRVANGSFAAAAEPKGFEVLAQLPYSVPSTDQLASPGPAPHSTASTT
jgi:signal transduction histidine kinase